MSGVAPGGTGGHHNVDGRDRADTGGRGHAVVLDNVADVSELAVGEDEANVTHHTGEELRECGTPGRTQHTPGRTQGREMIEHNRLLSQNSSAGNFARAKKKKNVGRTDHERAHK